MTIHIIDDKELNERMEKVFEEIYKIFKKEKFTAKDILWVSFVLQEDIKQSYYEQGD